LFLLAVANYDDLAIFIILAMDLISERKRVVRRYTERKSFMVPAKQKAQFKARAAEEGISLSELIRRAIDRFHALNDADQQAPAK
jgi:LDH2 family malate/lactate/ureidoglycolate dehydrogenase